MKNVVIIYSGREGSSAIVSSLGKHSQISLPIFEHMDYANVKQRFGRDAFDKVDVALNNLLSGYGFGDSIFEEKPGGIRSNKHIVFKWRPWGDMVKVAEKFREHDVLVLSLARKDVVNHALSKYFTNRVISEGKGVFHPQFHVKKLDPEEREAYIKKLRESDFSVDVDKYVEDLESYVSAKEAMCKKVFTLEEAGVEVKHVFYEDFLSDNVRFLGGVLDALGLECEESVSNSDFVKVNRDNLRDQVLNIEAVEGDRKVCELVAKYLRLF